MITKLKPTSTPWEVSQAGENIYIYINVPSEHWPIHNVIANIDDDMGNAEANAAFILRAVNAHEELIQTLKRLRDDFTDRLGYEPIYATQAIAKAEGK